MKWVFLSVPFILAEFDLNEPASFQHRHHDIPRGLNMVQSGKGVVDAGS